MINLKYKVRYDTDVPHGFNSNVHEDKKKYIDKGINVRNFFRYEIDKWSNNKEELELILAAKNYNL